MPYVPELPAWMTATPSPFDPKTHRIVGGGVFGSRMLCSCGVVAIADFERREWRDATGAHVLPFDEPGQASPTEAELVPAPASQLPRSTPGPIARPGASTGRLEGPGASAPGRLIEDPAERWQAIDAKRAAAEEAAGTRKPAPIPTDPDYQKALEHVPGETRMWREAHGLPLWSDRSKSPSRSPEGRRAERARARVRKAGEEPGLTVYRARQLERAMAAIAKGSHEAPQG